MERPLLNNEDKQEMTTREIVEAYLSRCLYHEDDFQDVKDFENIIWIKAKE